jgi:hypothetical protein
MPVNDNILKAFCEDDSKKSIPAVKEDQLMKQYLEFMKLHQDYAMISSAYDLANIIRSYNFWYKNKDIEPNIFDVNPGDVYYVDLGSFNLKYEEGYIHSCLVIKRFSGMVLVAPGSTKKYGKKNYLIEPVNAGDGFKENTGVMIDQLRCVSITRLRGTIIGQMNKPTLDKILDKIMDAYMKDAANSLKSLTTENAQLKVDIEGYKEKIKNLEEQIKNGCNITTESGEK